MQALKELIEKNLTSHPELMEYNYVVLNFITSHEQKRPDMCIEGCKSLIEGVAKFISSNIGSDYSPNNWRNKKFQDKFRECRKALKLIDYEDEFLKESDGLILKLGQVRNERGDVSHGQAYPKSSYSDTDFAKLISLWAEGLCYFMLSRYIDVQQKQKSIESTDTYSDEQFIEFNNYLDGLYPELTHISYSKALREQDGLQYELMMDEFYKNYE